MLVKEKVVSLELVVFFNFLIFLFCMNIKKSKNAVVSVCLIIFIENKKDATTTGRWG